MMLDNGDHSVVREPAILGRDAFMIMVLLIAKNIR
jgi:hypothetical protein